MTGSKYMLASYKTEGDTGTASSPSAVTPDRSTTTASTSSSTTPINVYLYAGDQIIENVTMGYFYYQDSLGNTSHVTDGVGNLRERYTYSAFGTPTFYNAAGAIIYNAAGISESALGIRHLFQGQLWTQETGLNDYRNRVELPTMGVFLQPDPIGFKGDAANIYRFCNNNAVNRTDPDGLYQVPSGISDEQKKQLENAQKTMADKLDTGANKIDSALKAGEDSKEFKSVKKDFEGVFGKPLTAKDMAGYAERARRMVSGLRDDGTKGYKMVARDQAYFARAGLPSSAAAGQIGGKVIFINTDLAFKPEKELGYSLPWILGHEAAHNQWVRGDIYRSEPQYKTLTPQQALDNADKHVEFADRQ